MIRIDPTTMIKTIKTQVQVHLIPPSQDRNRDTKGNRLTGANATTVFQKIKIQVHNRNIVTQGRQLGTKS
jgi:hypothetical protein